jgi:hypothetical protein
MAQQSQNISVSTITIQGLEKKKKKKKKQVQRKKHKHHPGNFSFHICFNQTRILQLLKYGITPAFLGCQLS